jgi:hypothetical protein
MRPTFQRTGFGRTLFAAVAVVLTSALLATCSSTPNSASGSRGSQKSTTTSTASVPSTTPESQTGLVNTSGAPNSMLPYIVRVYSEYVPEPTDETSGGPTGSIGFNEAESADCDAELSRQSEWVASFLEYFKHSPNPNPNSQSQSAYMTVCLTELKTQADASEDSAKLASQLARELPGAAKPVHVELDFLAPNTALFYQVGLANTVFFAKYNFFVLVVSVDETNEMYGKSFGVNMAGAESFLFNRAPSK